ncbi:gamma-glutamyltransferase [Solicola sp. PLA-1-18]|uniref:gamma-glutamyltransferase n=1 Tax=Solicola sp. PLA-1-18 TaxID=3380532 RepID=UPI003B7F72D2
MTSPTVAVAGPSELAAEAGAEVARAGGNAVDVALAASLVTMVNEVGIVSLSSGAFVTVQPPGDAAPTTVDGWVEMPGRGADPGRFGSGTWDVTTAYGGGVTATIGAGSVGTHGGVMALGEAHRRWGSLPWASVVAPAIEVARGGFAIGSASRHYLSYVHDEIFGWDAFSRDALHDADGELREHVVVDGLADTFRAIATEGPSAMYTGSVGTRIADAVQRLGGLMTRDDLAAYEVVVRPSLTARAGSWTLGTNPHPSVGGICVAAMLSLMDDRPRDRWTTDDVAHLLEVQRAVLGHRVSTLDTAPDLGEAARSFLALADEDGLRALESPSTTHVSAVDAGGGACSVTASSGYGSGVMAGDTGVWLNNCLGEPELNRFGRHALPPGTRLRSNMAPTVGRRDDGAVLAVGSPGADRISTAVAQVVAGFAGGMSLVDAVDHPRVHVRVPGHGRVTEVVDHEAGAPLPDGLGETLAYPAHDMYFGGVAAALHDPVLGLSAAADPRRSGGVRVV